MFWIKQKVGTFVVVFVYQSQRLIVLRSKCFKHNGKKKLRCWCFGAIAITWSILVECHLELCWLFQKRCFKAEQEFCISLSIVLAVLKLDLFRRAHDGASCQVSSTWHGTLRMLIHEEITHNKSLTRLKLMYVYFLNQSNGHKRVISNTA